MVRKPVSAAMLSLGLSICAVSNASAQQLICSPDWTPEYKCLEHCGPCAGDSSAPAVGGGLTPEQQMGAQLGTLGAAMIIKALQGNPAEDARKAQQAAQAAQRQKQAEEQRMVEWQRKQEIAKQRILGMLKGSESSPDLALKQGDSESALTVTEGRGELGTTAVTPTGIGSPVDQNGLQLKLGDEADAGIVQAKREPTTGSQPSVCKPSQDPSVVDLCGHGGVVDPNIVKNGGVAASNPTSSAGTTIDPTVTKQGRPCPFVNGEPQCGQAFKMERNQPCPLDTNGVPQCGAPYGAEMPGGNAKAFPTAPSAPPSPPQSAYNPNLSGQARQDAAARSANQASAAEYDEVGHEATRLQRQAANIGKKTAEGAIHGGNEFGPDGAILGGALGAGHGAIENHLEPEP